MAISFEEWVHRCIEDCKTCGGLNTASGAELLVKKFARHLDSATTKKVKSEGSSVTFFSAVGYPFDVVSNIEAVQDGSGDPSPENVRPLRGRDAAEISINNIAYEAALGRVVYGGSYDWSNGTLTENAAKLVLDGTEKWVVSQQGWFYAEQPAMPNGAVSDDPLCSHFIGSTNGAYNRTVDNSIAVRAKRVWIYSTRFPDAVALNEYLSSQYAAGTPVTVYYKLSEPTTTQRSGASFVAEQEENTVTNLSGNNVGVTWRESILDDIQAGGGGAIQRIESTDTENMVVLRDLESGSYVLYGRFVPYAGADSTMMFSSGLLANVIKRTADTQIQIFYPVNNCVQHLTITDTDYTRKDVYLNDLTANT